MASKPWAKTILRSRNTSAPDKVLSTLLVRLPRPLLAEWNTHRVFSHNAASTRAIPTRKLIEQVQEDPFIPLVWGVNIAGMQASGVHEDALACERNWLRARDAAVRSAESLMDLGLHKQIVGRVLEPWMWTLICNSATEWTNFLELRNHPAAEPHFQMAAASVMECLENDPAQDLKPGDWHLPFIESVPNDEGYQDFRDETIFGGLLTKGEARRLSVARCASTSYKTTDGFDMIIERAEAIYDKLNSKPMHASPFEHVAQAAEAWPERIGNPWSHSNEFGNFVGFRQLRKQLELAP